MHGDECGEGAERVPDDRVEGAVAVLQLGDDVEVVDEVGAAAGRVAVRRRVERDDAEALAAQFAHERREDARARLPAVREHDGVGARAPLVGDDVDAGATEARDAHGAATSDVVRRAVGGGDGRAPADPHEEREGEAAAERR